MFVRKGLLCVLIIIIINQCNSVLAIESRIDLSGAWRLKLDPQNTGQQDSWFCKKLPDSVNLPGTLDENQKGTPSKAKPEMTKQGLRYLTRKYSYIGPAWYQRVISIPEDWANKKVTLFLERVLWESTVWIDDNKICSQDSLVTPHVYDISKYATSGRHTLTIRVDNSYKYNIGSHPNHQGPLGHAYTEETQTIWNGIIGEIYLQAADLVYISDVKIYPDLAKKQARLEISIANETCSDIEGTISISCQTSNTSQSHEPEPLQFGFSVSDKLKIIECEFPMGDDFLEWDEFKPALYDLKVSCQGKAAARDFKNEKTVRFGMREFKSDKNFLSINGRRTFLRGNLECCIFPLTGHPPMDVEGWLRVFNTAGSYGLNHLRFHSWCPPEAAFATADRKGFYLQVELPIWIPNAGQDPPRDDFMKKEGYRILEIYGNHPSFCMLSMGNELMGDFSFLHDLVSDLKARDPRHLYTSTTFSFQWEHGRWPEEVDDYFISQQTTKGWARGQGYTNQNKPSTDFDYSHALEGLKVPFVSHEIGQAAVYPNIDEIEKYTGVLVPLNFIAIKNDLKEKGLLKQARDFTKATGRFSVELYKSEIELALRTPGTSGFQLLQIQDFSGQGTALVGFLDAFWDSKGLITPKDFRRFCSPTVPLIRMPKYVYYNNETFKADVEVAHFGPETLKNAQSVWTFRDDEGKRVAAGQLLQSDIPIGNGTKLGSIRLLLNEFKKAQKLNVGVAIKGTNAANDWDIWVYPHQLSTDVPKDIIIADSLDEKAIETVNKGGKVLLLPKPSLIKGKIQGRFVPVFWSPVHFTNQPGTMGILCDPAHPALENFPTEFHSNWQWWDLNINSVVFKLDDMPEDIEPIVQVVDNFARNSKLATVIEAEVGNAEMIICSIDLTTDIDSRPAAKQLKYSIVEYMKSEKFSPDVKMRLEDLNSLFKEATIMTNAKVIYTDSSQPVCPPENAIDNDSATLWSTEWFPEIKKHPHEIVIDLGQEIEINGFTYLPRQDGNPNGLVKDYEFYISGDSKDWGEPAAKGTFDRDDSLKKVSFYNALSVYSRTSVKARFIRFVALKGFDDDPYTTMAELEIMTE